MINPDFVYATICNVHEYRKPKESWGDAFMRLLDLERNIAYLGNDERYVAILDSPEIYKTVCKRMSPETHIIITKTGGLVTPCNPTMKVHDYFELPELTEVAVTVITDRKHDFTGARFSMKRLLAAYPMNELITILNDGFPSGRLLRECEIRGLLAKRYASEKGFNGVLELCAKVIDQSIPVPSCKHDFMVMDFSNVSYYEEYSLVYDKHVNIIE
jgi:hypothetical protein